MTAAAAVEPAALPKVELHLHLDCCVSFPVAAQLDPTLTEAAYRALFVAPARCRNFAEWVTHVDPALDLLQTEEGLRLATEDLFDQLRRDNVIYAELRFAPLLHTRAGLSPTEVVRIVDEAAAAASRRTGIEGRLILCTLRHFAPQQSLETAELVARFAGTRVAALDIAGDEEAYPLAPHAEAFAFAKRKGIPTTAHAGEWSGAGSVRETLALLAPRRIGHGMRCAEDADLVARLAQERIHLEVCPTSNVQTGAIASPEAHPIDRLYRAGVSLGVSTDARAVCDVTLADEYARLIATHDWGVKELRRCADMAADAAFVSDDVRSRLKARLAEAG